ERWEFLNGLPHDSYPDPQPRDLPIIIEQVLAISGEALPENVEVEVGIDDAIERIGEFGVDRAFSGREVETAVGREAQSVVAPDLGEEGCVAAIALDVGIVGETAHVEGKRRTEQK